MLITPLSALAQGTAFNYQGQLNLSNSPANGVYDLRFTIYDSTNNPGTVIAGPIINSATPISNGLFTATLDFGIGVFTGPPRWLQLDVQTNGASPPGFTTLFPRQQILPAPYAVMANTASNLVGTLDASQISGSGTFAGNGAGLTNLNASQLTSGTIALAQLPAAVVTNDSPSLTIGGTNVIAPLTVPLSVPAAAIGSVGTGSFPTSLAVAGRYVYVVNENANTLQVFDASTPSAPVSVGSVSTAASPYSIAVAGSYAYVLYFNPGALQVFDVSTPSKPVGLGSAPASNFARSVAVAGRYAYVVSGSADTLQVFDVSTPSAPVLVGSVGTGSGPFSIAVAGRYAYLADTGDNALQIFDVSTPSAPVLVGSAVLGVSPQAVAVVGRYAYVVSLGTTRLQIFDVSTPSAPVLLGAASPIGGPTTLAVAGRYAYVLTDNDLLQVFDVSSPSAPISIGSVLAGNNAHSVAISGRYAYVVSATVNTLQVFDFGGAFVQQFEAGTIETGTLQTRDTVTVGNNLDVRGGLTASASARISGGLGVTGGLLINSNILSIAFGATNVGIGMTNPSYSLQVNGSVAGVGAYVNTSDARFKTNIAPLTHALDKIMALRGVQYDWRAQEYPQMRFDQGKQLGFIAQELEDVLPEVVTKDAAGYYSIAYSKVIPVLVEALKEAVKDQQNAIAAKDAQIQAQGAELQQQSALIQGLERHNQSLEERLRRLESALPGSTAGN